MGLRRQMNNSLDFLEYFLDKLFISNIPLNKFVTGILFYIFQVVQVARIRKLVKVNDFATGIVLQQVMNEIASNKTCPPSDQQSFILKAALVSHPSGPNHKEYRFGEDLSVVHQDDRNHRAQ